MGPSNAGAPTVSEPNLKLRYKPKKSLERRKNPLLRKESAPPSLRRRPAEALGGEDQQSGWGRLILSFWVRFYQDGSLPQGYHGWLYRVCPTRLPGSELGLKGSPCSVGETDFFCPERAL